MNKIEQMHLDAIKYEEVDCMTQDGEHIKFVENDSYYDVAVKSAEITSQIAVEFAVWLNKTDDIAAKTKHIDFTKSDEEVAKDLFQEFLKTKQ